MYLERKLAGTMVIPNGILTVTDPCYDDDVWCTDTISKMKSGVYNCYYYIGDEGRVAIAQIVNAEDDDADETEEKIHIGKSWRRISEIGVDAGLAGFFVNKPNFPDDEWLSLCKWMYQYTDKTEIKRDGFKNINDEAFVAPYGFWTSSGYGDGAYPVYAIRNSSRKIVALEIRFM